MPLSTGEPPTRRHLVIARAAVRTKGPSMPFSPPSRTICCRLCPWRWGHRLGERLRRARSESCLPPGNPAVQLLHRRAGGSGSPAAPGPGSLRFITFRWLEPFSSLKGCWGHFSLSAMIPAIKTSVIAALVAWIGLGGQTSVRDLYRAPHPIVRPLRSRMSFSSWLTTRIRRFPLPPLPGLINPIGAGGIRFTQTHANYAV
jgi:hypothetical protein